MFYRSKLIAAAAVALFAATGAQAVTVVNQGTLVTPQTWKLVGLAGGFGQAVAVGSFSFDFTFTITQKDSFSSDGLTYKVLGATSGLSSFSAYIDAPANSFTASSARTTAGNRAAFENVLSFNASKKLTLAPGVHHLYVSGVATKAATLNGSFNIVAAPVPEPETYAMMLAGLGVVGLLSARRRQG